MPKAPEPPGVLAGTLNPTTVNDVTVLRLPSASVVVSSTVDVLDVCIEVRASLLVDCSLLSAVVEGEAGRGDALFVVGEFDVVLDDGLLAGLDDLAGVEAGVEGVLGETGVELLLLDCRFAICTSLVAIAALSLCTASMAVRSSRNTPCLNFEGE